MWKLLKSKLPDINCVSQLPPPPPMITDVII